MTVGSIYGVGDEEVGNPINNGGGGAVGVRAMALGWGLLPPHLLIAHSATTVSAPTSTPQPQQELCSLF